MTTDPKFFQALNTYIASVQALSDKRFAEVLTNLKPDVYSAMVGKRYVKVIATRGEGNGRRVHTFVDTTNGDVLMAAGWKAPAKHARGNIYSEQNGMEGVNEYGGRYLR